MADFHKYPRGKDQEAAPGIEMGGAYYSNLDLIVALAKALVKNGAITKQQIKDEL